MTARPSLAIAEEVISEAEAVRRVPGRDSDVRAWLRGLGVARRGPTGATCYRWSEVVAALPLVSEPASPPVSSGRSPLRRSSML